MSRDLQSASLQSRAVNLPPLLRPLVAAQILVFGPCVATSEPILRVTNDATLGAAKLTATPGLRNLAKRPCIPTLARSGDWQELPAMEGICGEPGLEQTRSCGRISHTIKKLDALETIYTENHHY